MKKSSREQRLRDHSIGGGGRRRCGSCHKRYHRCFKSWEWFRDADKKTWQKRVITIGTCCADVRGISHVRSSAPTWLVKAGVIRAVS